MAWRDVPLFDVGDGPVAATGRGEFLRVRLGVLETAQDGFQIGFDVYDSHPRWKRDKLLLMETAHAATWGDVPGLVAAKLITARGFLPPF